MEERDIFILTDESNMEPYECPMAELTSIQFGVLTSKEIEKISVYSKRDSLQHKPDLLDPSLGLPNRENLCVTCGAKSFKHCPGHFGHLDLPTPIYHPNYIHQIVRIINKICPICCEIKNKKGRKFHGVEADDGKSYLLQNDLGTSAPDKGLWMYCKAHGHLNVKLKVKRCLLNNEEWIETIELQDDKSDTCDNILDFWRVAVESSCNRDSDRKKLWPFEALKLLRRIPEMIIKKLDMNILVARPEALIVKYVVVSPNCLRCPEQPVGTNLQWGYDRVTQMMRKIVRKVDQSRSFRYARASVRVSTELEELQALFAQLLRLKGAPKVKGNKEPNINCVGRRCESLNKPTWASNFQKHILGKISCYSSRGVITGDPYLDLQDIGVPFEISKHVTIPLWVTDLNVGKIHDFVKSRPGTIFIDDPTTDWQAICLDYMEDDRKLEIGVPLHLPLKDGDMVFCNRPPSLHKHSIISLKARIQEKKAFAINPMICAALGADFDGDCIHAFVPQMTESQIEAKELLIAEKQILLSHGGQPTFVLGEDAVFAAHYLSTSFVFIDKKTMQKLSMATQSTLSSPVIMKSPKGSYWTGYQLLELSLPKTITYKKHGVYIHGGEFLYNNEKSNLFKQHSVLECIVNQVGSCNGLHYLNMMQRLLIEYLSVKGLSIGLQDLCATKDFITETKTHHAICLSLDMVMNEIIDHMKLLSMNFKNLPAEDASLVGTSTTCHGKNLLDFHSDVAARASDNMEGLIIKMLLDALNVVQKETMGYFNQTNSLLAIVRAGSKGSYFKLQQQLVFLGFQPYKGKSFHSVQYNNNASFSLEPSDKRTSVFHKDKFWTERGLIKSSFAQGLTFLEFFIHAVSSREGMLYQGLEVKEPGLLCKNLMHFTRDIYIAYDGTVRHRLGNQLIQFQYGGMKENSDNQKNNRYLCRIYRDNSNARWKESILAGEPVGILAANALVQPVYSMLLGASARQNMTCCPIKMLKETLYSHKKSTSKLCDRKVVLHFQKNDQSDFYRQEKAALHVQNVLRKITLKMLAAYTIIEYDWDAVKIRNQELPMNMSPLIGHIVLCKDLMDVYQATLNQVSTCLQKKVKWFGADLSVWELNECNVPVSLLGSTYSPCIHYSVLLPKAPLYEDMPNRYHNEMCHDYSFSESLSRMRSYLPNLLETNIFGDHRIQSAVISWEEPQSASRVCNPCQPGETREGEIALNVIVEKRYVKARSDAWRIVVDACLPVIDLVDWARSIPFSVQEIYQTLGTEAASRIILQRLEYTLSLLGKSVHVEHLRLIADAMAHSGCIMGYTAAGFREYLSIMKISAPLMQGAYQNPIKHFQNAATKGVKDKLAGVVASTIWGKSAPVGTRTDFEIVWKQGQVPEYPSSDPQGMDIYELLKSTSREEETT